MSFYHGTSAGNALKILQSGKIQPSEDGYFYCFDSNKPESLAGALCFATGDGPRNGSLTKHDFLSRYAKLNPDFPTGLKGLLAKTALKHYAAAWAEKQMQGATGPLDRYGAILVFHTHPDGEQATRQGFVNEVKIPAASLSELELERVWLDDALLHLPEIEQLRQLGVDVRPLSECADLVWGETPQKKPDVGHSPPGPK